MNTQQLISLVDMWSGGDVTRVYMDSIHYHKLTWWLAQNDTGYSEAYPKYQGIAIYKVESQEEHIYFC